MSTPRDTITTEVTWPGLDEALKTHDCVGVRPVELGETYLSFAGSVFKKTSSTEIHDNAARPILRDKSKGADMALDLSKPLRRKGFDNIEVIPLTDGFFAERPRNSESAEWWVNGFKGADLSIFLENVPETRELDCWVNVHDDSLSIFYTKERADTLGSGGRIACLHIQRSYEVGEGLS